MSDEAQEATWPVPKCHFKVQIDGAVMLFREVSGLGAETEVIAYRAGDAKTFSNIKMPGRVKHANITLKKSLFIEDDTLYDWINQISMNIIERKDIKISLVDENDTPRMVWEIKGAYITKMAGTEFRAEDNGVAVEAVEIAFETMTILNG